MSTLKRFFKNIKNYEKVSRYLPLFSIVIFTSVVLFSVFAARSTEAETGIPFGGLSTFIMRCTCNANPADIAVTVTDLSTTPGSPPNYVYSPGVTILHPFGMVNSTGVWLLGNRQPGSICMYRVGRFCSTWPTDGTMVRVGTSM